MSSTQLDPKKPESQPPAGEEVVVGRIRTMRRLIVLLVKLNRQKIMSLPKPVRKEMFFGEEHYTVPVC